MIKHLLTSAFLCASASCFGQHSLPQKGDNTIIVTLPDSGQVAWRKLVSTIASNGFAVKASDVNTLTVATDRKALDGNLAVGLSASIQGRKAIIKGSFSNYLLEATNLPATYTGKKSGTMYRVWAQLEQVVKALDGSVSYLKQ